jgi:pilus assembly protein CpaF
MKLTERLEMPRSKKPGEEGGQGQGQGDKPPADPQTDPAAIQRFLKLKSRLHAATIDKLDTRSMVETDPRKMRERVRLIVDALISADAEASGATGEARYALINSVLDEIVGLGPLEPLVNDPEISDILVNRADQIFVEKRGKLELTTIRFADNQHLLNVIQRIVSRVGRRVDESSPLVDARLADGSRVNAVVPPIAPDGAVLSIRRFGKRLLSATDLVARGVGTMQMIQFLAAAVHSKTNLLVSGGTGSGKTTMLNLLSSYIPNHERVITIEDSVELALMGQHVVRMEARPANIEGKGEVSIRACVKNALRMRPDRVIIGEIRGGEVLDMLQAMNTGHEGSMATVHANTPRDAMDRLTMMLALSGVVLEGESVNNFIASSVRLVVQVARFPDGTRRITHISEVEDYIKDRVNVRHIFSWKPLEKRFVYHNNSTFAERFAEHSAEFDWGAVTP